MAHEVSWDSVVARLRKARSLTVVQFETGGLVTEDDLEVIRLLKKKMPPPAIMQFFRSSNGVKLLWNGTLVGEVVQGSINIVSLVESSMRASAEEGGEPLEGVLWNEEFSPSVLKDLKRMAIFESIAGQSAYLTYLVDKDDASLFMIEDDQIRPIVPDFETTIEMLKFYAGADALRGHLTYQNWRERIGKDEILQKIAAL
jgi:hypothetical protein